MNPNPPIFPFHNPNPFENFDDESEGEY